MSQGEYYRDPSEREAFDVLASVYLLRFDLMNGHQINPETWQRVYDEELSYIAEGINRPMATSFVLQEKDGDLVYFDKGQWRSYMGMLITGIEASKRSTQEDPRKQFLVDRAVDDLDIGYKLRDLRPGETLAWCSTFPDAEVVRYGATFVRNQGFQVDRRMGFLYHAARLQDGSLVLNTQSVDNSDREAFQAALAVAEAHPENDITTMLEAYDEVMMRKHDDYFVAGRRLEQGISEDNAWEVIQRHHDLLGHYFNQLLDLAQTDLTLTELKQHKIQLTYGVWAALKKRLDTAAFGGGYRTPAVPASSEVLQHEINQAYREASERYEMLVGCGGAMGADGGSLDDLSPDEALDFIFGAYEPSELKCVHCPLCDKDGVDAKITYVNKGDKKMKRITCKSCKKSKEYAA